MTTVIMIKCTESHLILISYLMIILSFCSYACQSQDQAPQKENNIHKRTHQPKAPSLPSLTFTNTVVQQQQKQCLLLQQDAERQPSWLKWESVTQCRQVLARIIGTWDAWQSALASLKKSQQLAPANTGPVLTSAALKLSLHQQEGVLNDIKIIQQSLLAKRFKKKTTMLHADLLKQQGKLKEACALYHSIKHNDLEVQTRQADCLQKKDPYAQKKALESIPLARLSSPLERAWVMLNLAWDAIHKMQWKQAEEYLHKSHQHLPHWFEITVAQAYMAEQQGDHEQALYLYHALAQKLGRGQWYQAASDIALKLNQHRLHQDLKRKAIDAYHQLHQWAPEVAIDHGIDFMTHWQAATALSWLEKDERFRVQNVLIRHGVRLARALWMTAQDHKSWSTLQQYVIPKSSLGQSSEIDWTIAVIAKKFNQHESQRRREAVIANQPVVLSQWSWLLRQK